MNLLEQIATIMNATPGIRFATSEFETGTFNRLADSDDYIAVIPQEVTLISADDCPLYEAQNARITIYAAGDWHVLEYTIVNACINAGLFITSRTYGGYSTEDNRHAYNIDVAQSYPFPTPEPEPEPETPTTTEQEET